MNIPRIASFVKDMCWWYYSFVQKISKAIIPVAGLGTRFLPVTRVISKEMIPLIDKPVIQYIIDECVEAGAHTIIFVVNKNNSNLLRNYLNPAHARHMHRVTIPSIRHEVERLDHLLRSVTFRYVEQKKPLGEGDALLAAQRFIKPDEPFFVSVGDILVRSQPPCFVALARVYQKYRAPVFAVERISRKAVSHYGVIRTSKHVTRSLWRVGGIVEKPHPQDAPSLYAMVGKYVLTPQVFDYLRRIKIGSGAEIKLAYALDTYAAHAPLYAYETHGTHFDCGDKLGFLRAILYYGIRHQHLKVGFKHLLRLTRS